MCTEERIERNFLSLRIIHNLSFRTILDATYFAMRSQKREILSRVHGDLFSSIALGIIAIGCRRLNRISPPAVFYSVCVWSPHINNDKTKFNFSTEQSINHAFLQPKVYGDDARGKA